MQKAVALGHDRAEGGTPRIVASGRGAVAGRILDLAFAHGVKVREDHDLVDILEVLELGTEVPVVAYAAVAEILAHLYRAHAASRPASDGTGPLEHQQSGFQPEAGAEGVPVR